MRCAGAGRLKPARGWTLTRRKSSRLPLVNDAGQRKGAPLGAPIRATCRRCLDLGVHLGRRRLEFEADEGFVADHPCVVVGLDDIRLACPDLSLAAVLVGDVNPAGLNDANMPHLTGFGPGDRLDALRPLPSGFERQAGCRSTTHLDDVHLSLVRPPGFVGCAEGTNLKSSHTSLLSSSERPIPNRVGDRSLILSLSLVNYDMREAPPPPSSPGLCLRTCHSPAPVRSHMTSHEQQHDTRLATNPDRPAQRVSQSHEHQVYEDGHLACGSSRQRPSFSTGHESRYVRRVRLFACGVALGDHRASGLAH